MTPRHFTWQAWHLVTSTSVSRDRSFCVAGVSLMALLVLPSSSRRPHVTHNTTLSHTIFQTQLSHTTLSHTIFHTPSFTHHFVTHRLSTLLDTPRLPPTARMSHTTQLCHTPSFTHNYHTQLCQPASFTDLLSHTTFTHTHKFVTHHLSHTPSFTHSFVTHHL